MQSRNVWKKFLTWLLLIYISLGVYSAFLSQTTLVPEYKLKALFGLNMDLRAPIIYLLPDLFLLMSAVILLLLIAIIHFKPRISYIDKKLFSLSLLNYAIILLSVTLTIYVIFLTLNWSEFYITYTNYKYINWDNYATIIKILILITSLFVLFNSRIYIWQHQNHIMEYTLLIVLAIVFLITLVSSNNFIMIFISIIGFSLNIYVLLMADVSHHTSLEAGIKYFYLSALSSGLLISGVWLAYVIFLTSDFAIIKFALNEWAANCETGKYLGILQIMVYSIMYGFLFKLAAFPCHLWAPEIYQGSPNPVMAFFILPVKIATFAIFMRIITNVFHELYILTSYLLWFSAITSMLWGCLGAFTEMQTKKFIAFSSINQMGFLLIGVTCATFLGIRATFIYLFIYILMNLGFLQIFLTTVKVTRTKTWTIERTMYYLTDFQYFAQHNWAVSIILVIVLFSMAGIPPLAGFFGKYFLFLAAMESGYFLLVIVGMVTSLVSTFYYIRIIKIMWFDQLDNIDADKPRFVTLLTKAEQYPLKWLAFFIIMFFIFIDPIISFTNIMAVSC